VVTGANSGLGLATARELARRGAHVVLACRGERRGRAAVGRLLSELPEARVELRLLDLAILASVREFAAGWRGFRTSTSASATRPRCAARAARTPVIAHGTYRPNRDGQL
jgi:NAD(P)-dependent dehydrogenase (short-subunit alcohol dehydrogenase family)